MAEKRQSAASKEAKAEVTREEFDNLAAKVRRMSDNWQTFVNKHIGTGAVGGKIIGLLLVLGMIAASVWAANLINLPTPSGGTGFVVTDAGNATVGGTLTVNGATTLTGAVTAGTFATSEKTTTNALTLTSAHYGTMILVNTNAAVTLTLPANGAAAGSWIAVSVHGEASDSCAPTIAAATVDTLIGPNDPDLDSVTWGSGHRMGAQAKFWSDGSFWHVQNLGGTTMTYTD